MAQPDHDNVPAPDRPTGQPTADTPASDHSDHSDRHPGSRRAFLGGVSRGIFQEMTLPVLMSH